MELAEFHNGPILPTNSEEEKQYKALNEEMRIKVQSGLYSSDNVMDDDIFRDLLSFMFKYFIFTQKDEVKENVLRGLEVLEENIPKLKGINQL